MTVSIIVAMARDRAIGRDGDMVFHIREDLRRFRDLTMGHPVVMGRRTFESLPKGALPGRRNIVITRNRGYAAPGIETVGSLEAALRLAGDVPEVFVIGGAAVYAEALPLASRLCLTVADATYPDADTRFPAYDPAEWHVVAESAPATDPRSGLTYRFIDLVRRF